MERKLLLFTDTDSLCYSIETENFYDDVRSLQHHFDTSDYPKDHFLYSNENKKVIGKFKDELGGKIMTEFVGFRSKLCAYNTIDGNEFKKAKGVTKAAVNKNLSAEIYKKVLDQKQQMWIKMNILRSKNHQIFSSEVNKTGLSPYDDERYVKEDGIHTTAY
jgi:hypothetical protein